MERDPIERDLDILELGGFNVVIGFVVAEAVLMVMFGAAFWRADATFGWRIYKQFSAHSAHVQAGDLKKHMTVGTATLTLTLATRHTLADALCARVFFLVRSW